MNIGAVWDLGREKPVTQAVAGKERHSLALHDPYPDRLTGLSVGRIDIHLFHFGEAGHVIEAATTDHRKLHRATESVSSHARQAPSR